MTKLANQLHAHCCHFVLLAPYYPDSPPPLLPRPPSLRSTPLRTIAWHYICQCYRPCIVRDLSHYAPAAPSQVLLLRSQTDHRRTVLNRPQVPRTFQPRAHRKGPTSDWGRGGRRGRGEQVATLACLLALPGGHTSSGVTANQGTVWVALAERCCRLG